MYWGYYLFENFPLKQHGEDWKCCNATYTDSVSMVTVKIQTPGIQLMKIACKNITLK